MNLANVILLVVMGSLWGLQASLLKLAAGGGWSELTVLVATLVLLSVIFVAIIAVRGELFRIDPGRIRFLVVTALLGYVAPLLAALYAAPHVTAGMLTLIAAIAPVLTVLIAMILRTERVSPRRRAGIALGLAASAVVLWPEIGLPDYGNLQWLLLAMVVPLCYGVEPVYVHSRWPAGLTSMQLVAGEAVTAAALTLPVWLLFGEPLPESLDWTSAETAVVVFVMAGVVETALYFYLIRRAGGVLVSFGSFIALFSGIGWGMLIFAEIHPPSTWFAVLLVVLALLAITTERAARES